MSSRRFLAGAAFATVLFTLAPTAFADDTQPQDFGRATPPRQYTAPLSQTTQPSYVPQSVALSGPKEIRDYDDGQPVPPGYTPVEKRRRGLIVGGAVTFGTLYLISAMVAAIGADTSRGDNPVAALWVPGVGPFIQMVKTDSAVGHFFLVVDGLAQSGGIAMLIIGIASPRTVLVRNDLVAQTKPTVRAVPLVTGQMSGVGVVGTF